MRLFYNQSTDPAFNLALEELLADGTDQELFMLWRNAPSIIIGRHQITSAEIDESYTAQHGITVVRRITGGGAVYHDLGNINFTCVSLGRTWSSESATRFCAPVVNALAALGLKTEFSGRNDIIANGRKVSGCARSVTRDHTLFHGTMLFDTDLSVLASALKPDPDKIRSKGVKSVRARVGNIREMLPNDLQAMDMDAFISHLLAFMPHHFGVDGFTDIPHDLQNRAQQLADSKYRTWEWNFGSAIPYDIQNKRLFSGGIIQANLNVRDSLITELTFTGDFFGTLPVDELANALIGQPPRRFLLKSILGDINVNDYIAGINIDELVDLIAVSD